jgi:hypothetical protein
MSTILATGQTVSADHQNAVVFPVVATMDEHQIRTTTPAVVIHADTHLSTCVASIVAGAYRSIFVLFLRQTQSPGDANNVSGN